MRHIDDGIWRWAISSLTRRARRYSSKVRNCFELNDHAGRDFQLDAMKGVAILLVVLGHAMLVDVPYVLLNHVFRIIYSFHVYFFFFLGGYLAYESTKRNSIPVLLYKKLRLLVVPYITWYLVAYCLSHGFSNRWEHGYQLPWFLWVFFMCFMALFAALILERYLKVFAYLLVLILVCGPPTLIGGCWRNIANYDFLVLFFPYFLLGYLVSRYKGTLNRLKEPVNVVRKVTLIVFPLLALLSLIFYNKADPLFIPWIFVDPAGILNPWFYLSSAVALLGTAFVFFLFRSIHNPKRLRVLSWLGKYTLDIYVIHIVGGFFFLTLVGKVFPTNNPFGIALQVVLSAVLAVIISLVISIFVLRQNRVLKLFFLGR